MKINLFAKGAMLTACLTVAGSMIAPAPALAQSSAFTGALVGAIIGTLLFDSSTHRYYYVNHNRRYYVNNDQARSYYQRQDPGYYNAHRSDFQNNPGRFNSGWQNSHHNHH